MRQGHGNMACKVGSDSRRERGEKKEKNAKTDVYLED